MLYNLFYVCEIYFLMINYVLEYNLHSIYNVNLS